MTRTRTGDARGGGGERIAAARGKSAISMREMYERDFARGAAKLFAGDRNLMGTCPEHRVVEFSGRALRAGARCDLISIDSGRLGSNDADLTILHRVGEFSNEVPQAEQRAKD